MAELGLKRSPQKVTGVVSPDVAGGTRPGWAFKRSPRVVTGVVSPDVGGGTIFLSRRTGVRIPPGPEKW